jgi:hypothetical protein
MKSGTANRQYLFVATTVLLSSVACAQSTGGKLGTLFYTPNERTSLVASRRSSSQPDAFSFDSSLSVRGLVRRGQQKSTVWINRQTVMEGQAVTSGEVPVIGTKSVRIDGRAVRVGEALDVESGARSDFIPQGSVSVRRQK